MMTNYSQEEKAIAATTIFKMKVHQTVEKTMEEHLQDTYGIEMIFKRIHMKKIKKYRWRIWNKPLLSSKTHSLKYMTLWRK